MRRRIALQTVTSVGVLSLSGCSIFEKSMVPSPLRRIRVVNLYDESIDFIIEIEGGDGKLNYGSRIEPISEGPSEEWVLELDDIDNAYNHTYTLSIENGSRSRIAPQNLPKKSGKGNKTCIELSWLINDPVTDIGAFSQKLNSCNL